MSEAKVYRIRVRGEPAAEWSAWFGHVEVENLGDGTSALTAPMPDQAALHGLLARVRDLGLEIVSVETPNEGKATK
jgi:hypothetical protein